MYKLTKKLHKVIARENNIYFSGEVNPQNTIDVVRFLFNHKNDTTINLYINSNGGSLLHGFLLYDLLKQRSVNTYCLGECSSAASIIYLAGKKRYITENSFVLIHNLSSQIRGSYNDLKCGMKNSDLLTKHMIQIYKDNTTMKINEIKKLLNTNLYLSPHECKKYGISTHIV